MSKALTLLRCRRDIIDIYNYAIEVIRPDRLIKNVISFTGNHLTVKDYTDTENDLKLDLSESNLHVIGGGKSVLSMAVGLAENATLDGASHLFSNGCLSLPIGLSPGLECNFDARHKLDSIGVKCLFGSQNNLPDEGSVSASRTILNTINLACDKDRDERRRPIFIVLLSGGGSACLTAPRHIDLEAKLKLIKFLVEKGANIIELNKVRRYFSSIKGGRLAQHILSSHPEARVVSLILSDVIGDPIEFIASGPTFIPKIEFYEDYRRSMLDILSKYSYQEIDSLISSDDEGSMIVNEGSVVNRIIGNNKLALKGASEKAGNLGYIVECLGDSLQGSTDDLAAKIYDCGTRTLTTAGGPVLVLGGGEATVTKLEGERWGLGGRAQEMALDYMISRMSDEPKHSEDIDFFLAGGTDGQDGPTDVAACMASYAEWMNEDLGKVFPIDQARYAKREHNSYLFWKRHKPDWLIKTGLTGTNVMDLYMFIVCNK